MPIVLKLYEVLLIFHVWFNFFEDINMKNSSKSLILSPISKTRDSSILIFTENSRLLYAVVYKVYAPCVIQNHY